MGASSAIFPSRRRRVRSGSGSGILLLAPINVRVLALGGESDVQFFVISQAFVRGCGGYDGRMGRLRRTGGWVRGGRETAGIWSAG